MVADEPTAPIAGAMWPLLQVGIVVGLALWEAGANVWWTVAGLALAGTTLAPALAWIFQRRRYLYLAAPLVNLAGLLAAAEFNWIRDTSEFVDWNIILLTLPVAGWLAVELFSIRGRAFRPKFDAPPMHRTATRVAVGLLVLMVGSALLGDAAGQVSAPPIMLLDWFALAATLSAAIVCLWDDKVRDTIALVYVLGLAACGTLLHRLQLAPEWLLSTGTIVLAAYALLTSYLWSRRRGIMALAATLHVPLHREAELAGWAWLVPLNTLLILSVVAMTAGIELTESRVEMRVLAAQATLVQVFSLALLARGDHRGVLQQAALVIGAVGAVFFGWAWLELGTSFTLLHALVVVAAAHGRRGGFLWAGLGQAAG